MGFERGLQRRDRSGSVADAATHDAPEARRSTVGKRTLVEEVYGAASHGVSGPSGALPYLTEIQRSFGRHDLGHVRAHVGGAAADGAAAMGADAFAMGDHVAFAGSPDLHTAAHEAAHVVQQRGGVQLKGGVGEAGDAYEQHADAVADLVVQGKSSEALLDRHAGGAGTGSGRPAIQRHAFINGTQVTSEDPIATGNVAAFVTDELIRDYKSQEELKAHAAKQTDYLGNLRGGPADGTWLRFFPDGTNLLGESHALVPLDPVLAAVGSKSFIHERFAAHDIGKGLEVEQAYNTDNADRFQSFGIENEPDKKKFGAEALLPKFGFVLIDLIPYLSKAKIGGLKSPTYAGKPYQRYLKMSWAFGKDCAAAVAKAHQTKQQQVPPKLDALAVVVQETIGVLDEFITGLIVDGYLGDALDKHPKQEVLFSAIARFSQAFIDALVEEAVEPGKSHLDEKGRQKFRGPTSTEDKKAMFSDWRNDEFAKTLHKAAQGGVRYVGMGRAHLLKMLEKGLPGNTTPFDMVDKDLSAFKSETQKLRAKLPK